MASSDRAAEEIAPLVGLSAAGDVERRLDELASDQEEMDATIGALEVRVSPSPSGSQG